GLLPQMQAFEHRLFEKKGSCDTTFVTVPLFANKQCLRDNLSTKRVFIQLTLGICSKNDKI
ncbi:TPA: hypothetical protein QFK08_000001, partial [Enterococcus faecium]